MRIHDVCQRCGLTRKAVAYYEEKGLLSPALLDNGYRDYGPEDVSTLKEIHVLRQCGLAVSDIQAVLQSPDRRAALEKYRHVAGLRAQRQASLQRCLSALAADYDVDRAFEQARRMEASLYTIQERLALCFPGNFGLFLSLHFGRFLQAVVDTPEKRQAYSAVIAYLDGVALSLPPELEDALRQLDLTPPGVDTAALEAQAHAEMRALQADPDAYLEQHAEEVGQYLAYRTSPAFWDSPTGQLQRALRAFQQRSGYEDILLKHLAVLSPDYAAYQADLRRANDAMLRRFPLAQRLDG